MLRDLGLTFVIRDEVLLITSPDEAAKPLFKRVYDVADLVPPEEREKGTAFDSLVDTVSKTADVDPTNKDGLLPWISSIKSSELAVIVVYQTEEAQEEVADLLGQLRPRNIRNSILSPYRGKKEITMFRKVILFLAFAALAVIAVRQAACQSTPAGGPAPGPAEATDKCQAEPREAIRQALTKKINWDFNELSLSDVVGVLHKELNIPIRLDIRALSDMGIAPDSPVTFKLSGISAKSALNLLLSDLGLTTHRPR